MSEWQDPRERALLHYLHDLHGSRPFKSLTIPIQGFLRWLDEHPEFDAPEVRGWVRQKDPYSLLAPPGEAPDGPVQ